MREKDKKRGIYRSGVVHRIIMRRCVYCNKLRQIKEMRCIYVGKQSSDFVCKIECRNV